jgi:hypothetical protein
MAHDPLCPAANDRFRPSLHACACDLIARVRANEGDKYGRGWMIEALRIDVKAEVEAEVSERIALAIERNHAQSVADGSEGDGCTCEVAAWIARRAAG